MKMINKTRWNTAALKRFVMAGLLAEGADHKKYLVTVKETHTKRTHGRAYYGLVAHNDDLLFRAYGWHYAIELRLPRCIVNWEQTAQVLIHEIGHTLGVHHCDMMGWWDIAVPWAADVAPNEWADKKRFKSHVDSDDT